MRWNVFQNLETEVKYLCESFFKEKKLCGRPVIISFRFTSLLLFSYFSLSSSHSNSFLWQLVLLNVAKSRRLFFFVRNSFCSSPFFSSSSFSLNYSTNLKWIKPVSQSRLRTTHSVAVGIDTYQNNEPKQIPNGQSFWAAFEKGTTDTITLNAERDRERMCVFESIEHSTANGQNSNQQWEHQSIFPHE